MGLPIAVRDEAAAIETGVAPAIDPDPMGDLVNVIAAAIAAASVASGMDVKARALEPSDPRHPPHYVEPLTLALEPEPEPELRPEPTPAEAPHLVSEAADNPILVTASSETVPVALTPGHLAPRADGHEAPHAGAHVAPRAGAQWARLAGVFALKAVAAYAAAILALLVIVRFVDPPGSALMALRWVSGTGIQQTWVPIGTMSPHLVRAVVVSEDWTFCSHNGIDIEAMRTAIEKAGDGIPRGASTISMQVAKNMFLWPSKSYVRKAIEVPLTLVMELLWPKRRILEIYLNVAEWGPGIFGAEAAAQHHFQKPASSLTAREAAQLAATLPNPFRRDAGDPGPQTARKASVIQARMRIAGAVANCILPPQGGSATRERGN